MTDQNASPQQGPLLRYSHHSSPSSSRDHDRVRLGHVTGSSETGESSRSATLMNSSWAADPALDLRPSDDEPAEHRLEHDAQQSKRSSHHHRSHKHKSTGAFLLSDHFDEQAADDLRGRKHRARQTVDKGKRASTAHSNEPTPSAIQSGSGLGLPPDLKMGKRQARQPPGTPPRTSETTGSRRQDDFLHPSPGVSSPGSSNASADMDSNQIVSMALNLSESRRLAQRRTASQTMPPRLAPLASDNTVAGALRQQLQQQRRASRTISPRPGREAAPRVVSNTKGNGNGMLQAPFEPLGAENDYRFNFSNSTLARAQKAKDYMELLAQHRRVIELLPPLKPNSLSRVPTNELSPSMPMTLDTVKATGQLGRPYNPLQYIRNRKVRARERKTIDGDSQGFGDVSRVTDWIDDVAKWVATRQVRTPGSPALPPFSGAEVFSMDHSPPAHIPRAANATVKMKRPRNDWIIEPANLLADIYWLEQDDHKKLVENRNWQRVFPQDSELYRPLSRSTDDLVPSTTRPLPAHVSGAGVEHSNEKTGADGKPPRLESADHAPSSTREKAREKLREIRGLHRHTEKHEKHGHNRLRVRRDSGSSSFSSEGESRGRKNTIGAADKDLLEKQMQEMMAREAQEDKDDEGKHSQEAEGKQLKSIPSGIAAAAAVAPTSRAASTPDSLGSSRQHSSRESRADASDKEDKNTSGRSRMGSPQRPALRARESLEVPSFARERMSLDSELSAPNSPDHRASRRDNYFIPGVGADLSPASSRAGSPSRNPLSIVKHIFRDRSRDRVTERQQETPTSHKGGFADVGTKAAPKLSSPSELGPDKSSSQSRTSSLGPDTNLTSRTTGDSHRSHRKTNSLRLEAGAGLRGLFKGPRIDSVFKSGVSRVSDLFWRKDFEAEDSDSSSSLSGVSEDESRGRRKNTNSISPTPSFKGPLNQSKKEGHFLDVMPAFVSTSDKRGTHSRSGSLNEPLSRKTSRRSARFELLRPPRIDISVATDTSSDQVKESPANAPKSDARVRHVKQGVKNGYRLPPLSIDSPRDRHVSVSAESVRNSRHFSIAEHEMICDSAPISRREIARLRTMVLSSGVMAMELSRRAKEPARLTAHTPNEGNSVLAALGNKVTWPELAQLVSDDQRAEILSQPLSQAELFPVTAHVLGTAIHTSRQRWESEVDTFKYRTRTELIDGRIEKLRQRAGLDLTAMTRTAAEEADEVGGDIVDGQRRKVKTVVDVIDKLMRRRRRRFRWVRRAGWLALEWLLVGFMWYVWFVVMIARIVLGVGKGISNGIRWLLWL